MSPQDRAYLRGKLDARKRRPPRFRITPTDRIVLASPDAALDGWDFWQRLAYLEGYEAEAEADAAA